VYIQLAFAPRRQRLANFVSNGAPCAQARTPDSAASASTTDRIAFAFIAGPN